MAKEKNFSNTDKTQPKKVLIVLNDGSVYWLEEENIKKMFSNIPGVKKPNVDMTKVFSNTPGVKKLDGDVTKVFSNYLKQEGQENTDKAQQDQGRSEKAKKRNERKPLFKDSDVAEMVSVVTKLDESGASEMMSNVSSPTTKEELKEIIDNMAENTDKTQPKKVLIVLNDGSVYWLEAENIKKMFSNIPGLKKPDGDVTKVFSNFPGLKKPDGDVTKVFSNYLKQEGQENTDKTQPKMFSNTPGAKKTNGDVTQERDAAQQNFDASVVHSNGLYDKYMKGAQDLQMLIDSASKMKSGLGSSGVKDYQALVQKIKANNRNN